MGKVIDCILKFDPGYKDKLEKELVKVAPKLYEAEKALLAHIIHGAPFMGMSHKECIQEILIAVKAVKPYWISRSFIDKRHRARKPSQVFRWNWQDIVRDRFGYLKRSSMNVRF